MKSTNKRYRTFLADSSKKFLKVGLLVSLVLVIVAFKAPIYGGLGNDFDPTSLEQEIDTIVFVNLPVPQKKAPPKLKEKKQPKTVVFKPVDIPPEDLPTIEIPVPVTENPTVITEEKVIDEPDILFGEGMMPEAFPMYPGGESGLLQYLVKAEYCREAINLDIEGTVYVSFTVNKKGKVTDIELERGVYSCLDHEALRMVKQMENWTPGKHGLSNVNVRMVLPFKFTLN